MPYLLLTVGAAMGFILVLPVAQSSNAIQLPSVVAKEVNREKRWGRDLLKGIM